MVIYISLKLPQSLLVQSDFWSLFVSQLRIVFNPKLSISQIWWFNVKWQIGMIFLLYNLNIGLRRLTSAGARPGMGTAACPRALDSLHRKTWNRLSGLYLFDQYYHTGLDYYKWCDHVSSESYCSEVSKLFFPSQMFLDREFLFIHFLFKLVIHCPTHLHNLRFCLFVSVDHEGSRRNETLSQWMWGCLGFRADYAKYAIGDIIVLCAGMLQWWVQPFTLPQYWHSDEYPCWCWMLLRGETCIEKRESEWNTWNRTLPIHELTTSIRRKSEVLKLIVQKMCD